MFAAIMRWHITWSTHLSGKLRRLCRYLNHELTTCSIPLSDTLPFQNLAHAEYNLLSQQDDTDGEVDVGNAQALTPQPEDVDGDGDDDEEADENDEEYDASTKKSKSPYSELSNLLNTRLQKLITKAPKEYVCTALSLKTVH